MSRAVVVRDLFRVVPLEGQLLMKKFAAFALLFVSLCVVGCTGDKKAPAGSHSSGPANSAPAK